MAYTVLARKYRSQTFDDLVGQEAIATTLKNAVAGDRVHHGYLFTGTRGVGKTSAARILAKALNCSKHEVATPTPCCECESCRLIAEGGDIDVIEIDAASNTGVDNIRDLRDNASYRPARSRFKIYIIDEVHMLSTGAFNALLKTLEEPPNHVKFIMATTEVQKVPATIVSRCQRFDFRSIAIDAIDGHLRNLLSLEGLEADDAVVRRVARLANGSMRDGLSILDQLLSFGAKALTVEVMEDILPASHDAQVAALFDHVADQEPGEALVCVEQALSSGQTMERFSESVVEHLRTLMLLNVCGAETEMVDVPQTVREQLVTQSQRFDAPTYVYMIGLMEEVRRSVRTSAVARALIDAAMVRLAMAANFSDIQTLLDQVGGAPSGETRRPTANPTAPKTATPRTTAPRATATPKRPPPETTVRRPDPPKTTRPSAASTVSSADQARAHRDPAVQQAMNLFDATVVSVTRAVDSGDAEKNTAGGDASDESGTTKSNERQR